MNTGMEQRSVEGTEQKTKEWNMKLVGLRIVRNEADKDREGTLLQEDLPPNTRVLPKGEMPVTQKEEPER
ncbi:hypothetical protein TRICI_000417 [Trichomonascus ciferrii]|uniref:Uncharacterized protein n=1 Tax=Trichomonascus ciferrii TaxID=44093 RepID=A0A642VDG6_9ASCO|nr:hypothetical protein TRICI_000417 [Trichomonascus ciferrii]